MDIQKLPGVGPVMAKKLNNIGIINVMQLLSHAPRWVADESGMDINTTEGLFRKAKKKLDISSFMSGIDVSVERSTIKRISTGTTALDKLFFGGIEARSTIELYGENGAGKSQFCHSMAVQAIKQTEGKVLWIDTEDTFRPERITSIAEAMELDASKILGNIMVARVFNSADQQQSLEEAENLIDKEHIELIIVDSSTGLFRSEYIGRGTLADRQGKINRFMSLASNVAQVYNIPIILTNQIQTSPGIMYGDPNKPVGGNIMGHESTYRVYLRKSGGFTVAKMMKSVQDKQTEVIFGVTSAGIVDKEIKEAEIKAAKKDKEE